MAEPTTIANRWLSSRLRGAGAEAISAIVGDRAYPRAAPQSAVYPFLIWTYAGMPAAALTQNGIRVTATLRYLVQGVFKGQSTAGDAATLASAIYTRLHRQGGAVTGGQVIQCTWDEAFEREEEVSGLFYVRTGSYYELVTWET